MSWAFAQAIATSFTSSVLWTLIRGRFREQGLGDKFKRGRRWARTLFAGLELPDALDQVAVLQFAGRGARESVGGGRLVSGKQFIREVFDGLKDTDPASGAVPSTFPLLRTLQLAVNAQDTSTDPHHRVIRELPNRTRARRGRASGGGECGAVASAVQKQ